MRPFYIIPNDDYEFSSPLQDSEPKLMQSFWYIEVGKEHRSKILEELNSFRPGPGVETLHLQVSGRVSMAEHADKIPIWVQNQLNPKFRSMKKK
jgi:hypothetical protein